ncbi:MAG TPA: GNAT family N-acetyltransferase [Flavobacteriales bacterium]
MGPAEFRIRPATLSDIPLIRDIAFATWPETYGKILPPGQLDHMLALMYSAEALREQMTAKGHAFLLAAAPEEAVGFASFGPHPTRSDRFRLHKLYVLPNTQGTGLGRALLKAVETECREQGGAALELNVNKHNRAKEFYLHHGFSRLRDEVLDIGNGYVMDDHVLIKPLG